MTSLRLLRSHAASPARTRARALARALPCMLACVVAAAGCDGALTVPVELPAADVAGGLRFHPDAGVRVHDASVPRAGIGADGRVRLVYTDEPSHRRRIASAANGLTFGAGVDLTPLTHADDPERVRMPNGTWRLFRLEGIGLNPDSPSSGYGISSTFSVDGVAFSNEAGLRYGAAPGDSGQVGVHHVFLDSRGRLVLLYVGDLRGVNNIRRARSTDFGTSFRLIESNPLGDYGQPRNQTFVDPFTLTLPDGRIRLFVMRANEIVSFVSTNGGDTFIRVPGIALAPGDFRSGPRSLTLNDPTVVRLADGRLRMYVASQVELTPGGARQWRILSATASAEAAARAP